MGKGSLEALSDGVIAIVITIMVLEMKGPHDTRLAALWHLAPGSGSYMLSFVFVGIYWNNHHHLLHATKSVDGRVLWANLHLPFWLLLTPFVTGWMGENHFETLPVALYGTVLLLCGAACYTRWRGCWWRTTVPARRWRRRWAGTARAWSRCCCMRRPFRWRSSVRRWRWACT